MLICGTVALAGCKEKKPQGEIFYLTTAYNNGYITREELLNVAYYSNRNLNPEIDENFQPIEKGELDEETKLKIQESFAYSYRNIQDYFPEFFDYPSGEVDEKVYKNTKASDIEFQYYGCYNGCYVIGHISIHTFYLPVYSEISIDGVIFAQINSHHYMYVWRDVEEYAPE
jgi:hypothetical protein